MRIESSVTSVSWIPSEAVTGPMNKALFGSGIAHYDQPPPDVIPDLNDWEGQDRFRFANRLVAWIDVEDGRVVGCGYSGGGVMGTTTVRLAGRDLATFAAPSLPDRQQDPEVHDDHVKFVQTTGGRTAFPAPRRVNHPPFVQFTAPLVWTTLALTIYADGRVEHEMTGASGFPRHWIYDSEGKLAAKAGITEFKEWWRHAFGKHTPWGDEESPALVTAVESALERELSTHIMRGGEKPKIRKLAADKVLVEQGQLGSEIYLLLDGVVRVDVDGEPVAELGPGAILGERAVLEGGRRTATIRTVTKARVAVAEADQIDREILVGISDTHRREEGQTTE